MSGFSQEHLVVRQADALIKRAIGKNSSDIHLEPTGEHLRVRFRIDGVLYDQDPIEKIIMQQLLSRLKVLSKMNIAEKRLPQDGKFTITTNGQPIDLRLSTFPSLYGEKMVIRILDRSTHTMLLDQLGMLESMRSKVQEITSKQNGFFLVTGPTGSGKTTTLYAILSKLHAPDKNIVTLEDPIEYSLAGVTQGPINNDAGFTFENGIRALLRQDPDILMVGEIRDKQTARTAIEAALTGHMVLSTLHTNDAPSSVMRLMDMGIEPFLLNASLSAVLAQRLVRLICENCKQVAPMDPAYRQLCDSLGLPDDQQIYLGQGCTECDKQGYRGRTGIFELLITTPELRAQCVENPNVNGIYEAAIKDGMITLLQDGIAKVKQGLISLDELARVII